MHRPSQKPSHTVSSCQQLSIFGDNAAEKSLPLASAVVKEVPSIAPSEAKVDPLIDPSAIHPSLWRASQLARPMGRVIASGIDALDAELPGGGWAEGSVSELIVKQ
jgi:protein ImuA